MVLNLPIDVASLTFEITFRDSIRLSSLTFVRSGRELVEGCKVQMVLNLGAIESDKDHPGFFN